MASGFQSAIIAETVDDSRLFGKAACKLSNILRRKTQQYFFHLLNFRNSIPYFSLTNGLYRPRRTVAGCLSFPCLCLQKAVGKIPYKISVDFKGVLTFTALIAFRKVSSEYNPVGIFLS